MYRTKASRMFRLSLVAALVVGLMVSTGTAVAYDWATEHNGTDSFQSEAVIDVVVDTNNDGSVSDPPAFGDTKITGITLNGPTEILRSSTGHDGNDPRAGEPDGLEDIRTEIVDMVLTGTAAGMTITIIAGSGLGLTGLPASTGAIEELAPGTDFPAYSFFDIYFELTLNPDPFGWGPLTNPVPARMAATITDPPGLPPYGVDYNLVSTPPVILKDGSGFTRVLITNVHRHTPLPPPTVPVFPNWYTMMAAVTAAGGLGYLIWRRRLAHEQR